MRYGIAWLLGAVVSNRNMVSGRSSAKIKTLNRESLTGMPRELLRTAPYRKHREVVFGDSPIAASAAVDLLYRARI